MMSSYISNLCPATTNMTKPVRVLFVIICKVLHKPASITGMSSIMILSMQMMYSHFLRHEKYLADKEKKPRPICICIMQGIIIYVRLCDMCGSIVFMVDYKQVIECEHLKNWQRIIVTALFCIYEHHKFPCISGNAWKYAIRLSVKYSNSGQVTQTCCNRNW